MVYPIANRTFLPFIRFFIRKSEGFENIPKEGPYIVACKHLASLDGVFLAAIMIPIIKQKIHFVSNVARWGWLWEKIVAEQWAGVIPFYRKHPHICLDIAKEYLKQGKIVGIFPEGLLERDKSQKRAKTGVARLAISSKVPILPISLKYNNMTRDMYGNRHDRWRVIWNTIINPHSLEIKVRKTFEIDEYYDEEVDKEMLVEATNKIMDKIEF
ncbi:MAG: lysophospholipid acyltransferase family protein [Candidatus Kerfeldbacteria bacterium]